ncbi:hypothetical protein BBJ28_00000968 [Nothophytophthora sp. Chile5]|nr:hypothetical protein BBJ28_00000968 [Nothophytophthora sp. Chile5]
MSSMEEFEKAQAQAMELLIQQCVTTQDRALSTGAHTRSSFFGPGLSVAKIPHGECVFISLVCSGFSSWPCVLYVRGEGDVGVLSSRDSAAANATILDFLAQTCADANAAVQELGVEEVASGLASAVAATQESLRSVGKNVGAILQDPDQMRELCYHVKQADAKVLEALQTSSALLQDEGHAAGARDGVLMAPASPASTALMVPADEENVRNMMVFAENMCSTMDHALSTITKDELDLAAQLSLNIAQKLLEAGQSLFMSLGDDERRKVRAGDRGDRITIEELADDDADKEAGQQEGGEGTDNDRRPRLKRKLQLNRAAVLRTYVNDMYSKTREEVVEHPFLAGALTAAGLPFIGLAIPVASLVGLALMLEKYYPEHATLTLELCSNFIQVTYDCDIILSYYMSKLWFLLLKISARQVGVVARECFNSCPNRKTQPDAQEEKEVETEVAIMSSESGSDSEGSNEDSSSNSAAKMPRFKFVDDAVSSKTEKLTTPSREEVTTDAKGHDDSESKERCSLEPDDVLTFSDDEETSSS